MFQLPSRCLLLIVCLGTLSCSKEWPADSLESTECNALNALCCEAYGWDKPLWVPRSYSNDCHNDNLGLIWGYETDVPCEGEVFKDMKCQTADNILPTGGVFGNK